jgi:hypothetical protein
MCTDKLLPLFAKAEKITNNKSHGKNIAEKLPSTTYALLNNYYWVLSIGKLLLTLKVHVRELFLKNYGFCSSLYWEITNSKLQGKYSRHCSCRVLFTYSCGTAHVFGIDTAHVFGTDIVWTVFDVLWPLYRPLNQNLMVYTLQSTIHVIHEQYILTWPLEETLCPLAII